jgi:hypothetical protein
MTGMSSLPASLNMQSTRGGTVSVTKRRMTPSCSNSRNCAVRTFLADSRQQIANLRKPSGAASNWDRVDAIPD